MRTRDIDDPTLNIPAESVYFRPDRSLIGNEEPDIEKNDNQPSFTNCTIRQRYTCLPDALRLLANQMTPRDALIFIGRFYFQIKVEDMEKIFRLDKSNISRAARKSEEKLRLRS